MSQWIFWVNRTPDFMLQGCMFDHGIVLTPLTWGLFVPEYILQPLANSHPFDLTFFGFRFCVAFPLLNDAKYTGTETLSPGRLIPDMIHVQVIDIKNNNTNQQLHHSISCINTINQTKLCSNALCARERYFAFTFEVVSSEAFMTAAQLESKVQIRWNEYHPNTTKINHPKSTRWDTRNL